MIPNADFPQGLTYGLDGVKVRISKPVFVGRREDFLWFPELIPLPNGELLIHGQPYADKHVPRTQELLYRSTDGGLNWTGPTESMDMGHEYVRLASGEIVILPYYRYVGTDGKTTPYNLVHTDGTLEHFDGGITVDGCWPRPGTAICEDPYLPPFVFNGNGISLLDGRYLVTLYGKFEGDERLSVICADSDDGRAWKIRSVIASASCDVPGKDGPSEASLCRLRDGRLLCVFRMGSFERFGKAFSDDEGKTWSTPEQMGNAWAVQPSLVTAEDGTVTLSGGRPGLHFWINLDGLTKLWQRVDIQQHHNTLIHDEPIAWTDGEVHWEQARADQRKWHHQY